MKAFAQLLDRLSYSPSRNAKLRLLRDYFRSTPDPDRGWALAVLTDGLPFSFPLRRTLMDMMARRMDPELFRLSRDYVGDTAETIALMWEEPQGALSLVGKGASSGETANAAAWQPPRAPASGGAAGDGLRLSEVVSELALVGRNDLAPRLEAWLDQLDATGRWALLKLLTGALRVGVSARLAKAAVAELADFGADDIEEIWHGLAPPYQALFAWLEARSPKPDVGTALVFRPLMLSHPLEAADWAALDLSQFSAEWKWDGIRVQVAGGNGAVNLFSRTGEGISSAFPDLVDAWHFDAVLDGELLVVRDGQVAPFKDLQQRLNRKRVSKRQMEQFPAHVRLYDALSLDGEDLRQLPLVARRARLEGWFDRRRP